MVSVLGIHTGSIVHVAGAALGISAVLATSAHVFTAVKLAGAAYLVFLGLRRLLWRSKDESPSADQPRSSLRRAYWQGVIVNVLNPKTALFFLAFLPQFVDPSRGPVAVQALMLGCCFIALGLCSDATYALVAGTLGNRLRSSDRFRRGRDKLSGITYIGLGVAAAVTGHSVRRSAA